jgi:ATP-dependent RNA helicase MSS116, mitochondrial
VTGVVQFGRPSDREQYIHRLGRTARGAGAIGRGVLVLADFEADGFLQQLKDLPVTRAAPRSRAELDAAAEGVDAAFRRVSQQSKEQAYQSTLGFYHQYLKTMGRDMDKARLVEIMNQWALQVAQCDEVPALRAITVGKVLFGWLWDDGLSYQVSTQQFFQSVVLTKHLTSHLHFALSHSLSYPPP